VINSHTPVAIIAPSELEAGIFGQALAKCNFRNTTLFRSTEEAYKVALRQQFPVFITRMEMPRMSGISFIQKIRMTGNYGIEPHLFVCTQVTPQLYGLLAEFDLDYVLTAPIGRQTIADKFTHLVHTENNISDIERAYRDAKSALHNGMLDMAETYCAAAIKANPRLEKAILLMGDIKLKGGDLNKAEKFYKSVISINRQSITAMYKLSQIMVGRGLFSEAADLLTKLSNLSPLHIRILEQAGLSNFEVKRYDLATEQMDRLRTLDETNKTAAQVTAQVKIAKGDYDGLVNTLKQGMDDKELIQFLNNAGAKLSKDNDAIGALKMYQAAIDQIEDSKYLYAIHYNMALAHRKMGEIDKALKHLDASLKIKPDFDRSLAMLEELRRDAASTPKAARRA
jgi:tetratricopeptide (TPR) repeat protein